MRTPTPARSRLAAVAAATLAAATLVTLGSTGPSQAAPSPKAVDAKVRVHWSNGKALGLAKLPPGQAVKSYLSGHGLGNATADTLRPTGPAWKANGVSYLRMEQYVGGLRVAGSYAKAAFNGQGKLIALIENASAASAPRAASVTAGAAYGAAVRALYPKGGARWQTAPTIEKVAVPMSDGKLTEGYVVTTWDVRNKLNETLVAGNGAVVSSQLRTASDGYLIYPEHPGVTPATLVTDPADPVASPAGWLAGTQWSNHISGNNANAYTDHDADNLPDPNDDLVTDGVFDTVFDFGIQPTAGDNPAAAVQNLFYTTNLIHDTLYAAGFTEEAGNFQENNFGRGGKDGDPVRAEAQDGFGLDNANFATPQDGKDPRMQMFLWNSIEPPNEVVQGTASYGATGAAWGAELTTTGVTGPLVVANDGTAPAAGDACESIPAVAAGSVVIADRGNCNFTVKAANAQAAGAAGVIIANNQATPIFTMGGEDASITIPAVMVSQADGTALKAGAPAATTMRVKDPAPILVDGDLDADIIWHEYGHGLTWRMIGKMSTVMSAAIGEGMADVLAVITGDDPVVAEYSFSSPIGLRSESYEGYSRTYGDIVGEEVHFDGEVYGAIGWDLWKSYKEAGLGQDDILADLVGGMNFTKQDPAFEDMRDGILMGLVASGHGDRACMVWNSFAQFGVGVGASGKVVGGHVAGTLGPTPVIIANESFAVPNACD